MTGAHRAPGVGLVNRVGKEVAIMNYGYGIGGMVVLILVALFLTGRL